eukprot:8391939-Ditylum_brightwellii.AAC.1
MKQTPDNIPYASAQNEDYWKPKAGPAHSARVTLFPSQMDQAKVVDLSLPDLSDTKLIWKLLFGAPW